MSGVLSSLAKLPARARQWSQTRRARRQKRGGGQRVPSSRLKYTPMGVMQVPVCARWADADAYDTFATTRSGQRSLLTGGSADFQLRYALEDMRGRSQYLDLYNPIYQAFMDRVLDVILGESGLTLQARTGLPEVNRRLERLWAAHRARPEVRGLDDHVGEQRMTLRHLFVDGDVGKILDAERGKVQLVEGERIGADRDRTEDGLRIESGVELSGPGEPQAFYVGDYDEHGLLDTSDPRRIAAADFVYLANRRRTSQTRGIPVQQANFAMFDRIEDICDSEAVAWQLLSRIAVAITKEDAEGLAQDTSSARTGTSGDPVAQRIQEIGHGLFFHGRPGEAIKGVEHNIPGRNFGESLKMFMRLLGLPLGFSLEFTLLIWSDTNYSSGRASKLQVERSCKPWCNMLAAALTAEYEWKIRQWVRDGRLAPRGDLFAHTWYAEPYPFLDPVKEHQAQRIRFECGTTAPSIEAKGVGRDLEDLVAIQETDLDLIAQACERHNTKHPEQKLTIADWTGFVRDQRRRFPWPEDGQSDGPTERDSDEG